MNRIFLFCSFLFAYGIVQSQTTIKLEDINQHIGDSVVVCGKAYGGRHLKSAKNSPTFLNIGAKYPDQLLTVVIWGDVRKDFTAKPEEDFANKDICITGKVELYKEKSQIEIRNPAQIKFKNDN
jgi:hypothetical protein